MYGNNTRHYLNLAADRQYAARIQSAHNPALAARVSTRDHLGDPAVQPWSAGELFPGVICSSGLDAGSRRYWAQYKQEASPQFSRWEDAAEWIRERKAPVAAAA